MLLEAQFQEKLMMYLYTWAGPEIAVASTKAYITQLLAMYIIALFFAENLKTTSAMKKLEAIKKEYAKSTRKS